MKAIILLSGGLDSTLAAELMSREGLELLAVNFKTPFCLCDRHSSNLGCGSNARRVAEAIGIDLKVINATKDFLEVLKKPAHGYGANMNPCIDCRILFFRKSKELMEEVGASFIITGEVLGQRPMSHYRERCRPGRACAAAAFGQAAGANNSGEERMDQSGEDA
jgi:tRNA-specific 2-thiouridylase